jgi:hypothetical protein
MVSVWSIALRTSRMVRMVGDGVQLYRSVGQIDVSRDRLLVFARARCPPLFVYRHCGAR